MIAAVPVGLCIVHITGKKPEVVYLSDRMLSIFGCTRQIYDGMRRGVLQIDTGPEQELSDALLGRIKCSEPGVPIHFKTKAHKLNGDTVWLDISMVRNEEVPEMFYISILDITGEMEKRKQEKWKEERYRLLSESSGVVTFDYNVETDVFVSSAQTERYGRRDFELPDFKNQLKMGNFAYAEDIERFTAAFEKALQGEGGSIVCRLDFTGNGWKWYRVEYISVKDDAGAVYRLVGRAEETEGRRKSDEKELEKRVDIRTFGYFDIFINGCSIPFSNAKAKEYLALLVDRQGGFVSAQEAISCLWENCEADERSMTRLRKTAMYLRDTLKEWGVEGIIETENRQRRIVSEKVNCDMYNFLAGIQGLRNQYTGSYMLNYSWSEVTSSMLDEQIQKKQTDRNNTHGKTGRYI